MVPADPSSEPASGAVDVVENADAKRFDITVAQALAGVTVYQPRRTDLYAFVDRCDHCGESLAEAKLGRLLGGAAGDVALRCSFCGTHFQVRRAGACLERPELHLDPLPLLVDREAVTVAVPLPVAV